MPNYIVIDDFLAPKQELESDGSRLQRNFKKGEFIGGKPNGYAKMKGEMIHVVKQSDGFVIPAKNLKQIDRSYGDDGGEEAKKMNEKVVQIVNRDLLKDTLNKSRSSMKGVVIGAFSGFAFALMKNKSLMWCGLLGAVSGGLIGYGINKVINEKEKKQETSTNNQKQ
jgi:hypothetical protein